MKIRISRQKVLSRCLTVGLMALSLLTFNACDKKDKPDGPVDTTPQITSFDPTQGKEGAPVRLIGKNFSSTKTDNAVTFNGKTATITEVNTQGTELIVLVPEDATTGKIVITVGGKNATSSANFTVNPLAPAINTTDGLVPSVGDIGTVVTINGSDFKAGAEVYFNNIKATEVTVVSATKITAKVPTGGTSGKVKVVSGGINAISATDFYVKPVVSSFTPASAKEGEIVTITGANFSDVAGETIINFGSKRVPDADVQVVSATELKVKVPVGVATTGVKIYVSVKDQMVETPTNFTAIPTLISYTPEHGLVGSSVTLTGKSMALDGEVFLGSLKITAFEGERTTTQIQFKVPTGATSGNIAIKQNGTSYVFGNYTVDVRNAWVKRNDGFTETYNSSVSFTIGGKLYLGLGRNASGSIVNNDFKIYDPATNAWTAGPAIPAAMSLRALASCFVLNNKAYIGLGNSSSGARADWWEYDPSKTGDAAWTPKANFPNTGYGANVFVIGTKVFAMNIYFHTGLHEYLPGTNTWTQVIPVTYLPSALYSTFFVLNGKGFFGGGWNSGVSDVRKAYMVDPGNFAAGYQPIADLPVSGDVMTSFAMNGKGYLIAGGKMYEYNPTANSWSEKCAAPSINGVYNATVIDGKAYTWDGKGVLYEYIP